MKRTQSFRQRLGLRLQFSLFLIIAWSVWFVTKVAVQKLLINQHVSMEIELFADISARLGTAWSASRNLLFQLYQCSFAFGACLLGWTNVLLPFVQDTVYVVCEYVGPFLLDRVGVPIYTSLRPLPGFVWLGLTWLNTNIVLEYKLGAGLLLFLLFNRRVSGPQKIFVLNLLLQVFLFKYTQGILVNGVVKLAVFAVAPLLLAISTLPHPDSRKTECRLANLLMYFAVAPILGWAETWVPLPPSALALVYYSVIYSGVTTFLYFLQEELLVDSLVFPGFSRRPVFLNRLLGKNFPFLQKISAKISNWKSLCLDMVVRVSFRFSENTSVIAKLVGLVRSTPTLLLIGMLILTVLAGIYYAYAALSRVVLLTVWPWYFSETIKVLLYRRREEYRSQVCFCLLFLGFELGLVRNAGLPLLQFFAGVFHLPLLFVFKLTPVLVVRLICAGPRWVWGWGKRKQSAALPPANTAPAPPPAGLN